MSVVTWSLLLTLWSAFHMMVKGRYGFTGKEMATENLPVWFSTSCKFPKGAKILLELKIQKFDQAGI